MQIWTNVIKPGSIPDSVAAAERIEQSSTDYDHDR